MLVLFNQMRFHLLILSHLLNQIINFEPHTHQPLLKVMLTHFLSQVFGVYVIDLVDLHIKLFLEDT